MAGMNDGAGGGECRVGGDTGTRHVMHLILTLIVAAAVACLAVVTYWQGKQVAFKDTPALIAAMHAFSRDLTRQGTPLPSSVSLQKLVKGGYIAADKVKAFDGMEVTISLTADGSHPQDVLIRVKLILICFQDECNYPRPSGDATHARTIPRQADQT